MPSCAVHVRARRRLDGSARMTDLLEAQPAGGRAEVPDDATSAAGERLLGDRRPRRARRDRSGRDRASTRTGTSTPPTARSRPPGTPAGCGRTGRGTIITLKGLQRQDNGGATHRREELEGPADPSMPPARGRRPAARDAVVEIVGDRTLGISSRSARSVASASTRRDGTVVELSVDDVEVARRRPRGRALRRARAGGPRGPARPCWSRWPTCWARSRSWSPVETSKLERALEAVAARAAARPMADERDRQRWVAVCGSDRRRGAGRRTAAPGRSGAKRRKAAQVAPPELGAVADRAGSRRRRRDRGAAVDGADPEAPRILVPQDARASSPTTTSPRRAARSSGSTSPAWSPARPGRATAGTPRSCTRCASPRAASGRPGACSATRSTPERTDRHRRRLKAVAADLGAVRDLDVLIEAGEAYQRRQPEDEAAAFEPLLATWRARRDAARGSCSSRSSTPSGTGAGSTGTSRSSRPRAWAPRRSARPSRTGCGTRCRPGSGRRTRRVRAYEPVMRWADVTTLHELRIAAKWLRYTLEFVREALGPRRRAGDRAGRRAPGPPRAGSTTRTSPPGSRGRSSSSTRAT